MNLSFQIQSEPKNPMLGITQPEVIEAVDENGSSMILHRRSERPALHYYNNGSFRGPQHLRQLEPHWPRRQDATTIKSLKAKVGIVLLSGTSAGNRDR